jgi:hypothetical protein
MKVAKDALAQPDAKGEYEFCQKLLIENISIIEKTEVYATGAIAGVIVFSASSSEPILANVSASIPFIIALIGFLRWIGLDSTISTINNYLVILGNNLPEGGWTGHYRKTRSRWLKRSRDVIWWILLLLSAIFFALTVFYGPFTKPTKPSPTLIPVASASLTPN